MTIIFNNLPGVDKLVKLDEELRKKAALVKYEKKEAVISTMVREEEFHYYCPAVPITRNVVFASTSVDLLRIRLVWEVGSFISRPMTYEEVKAQLDVLLLFLVDGEVPKMITDNEKYLKTLGNPL